MHCARLQQVLLSRVRPPLLYSSSRNMRGTPSRIAIREACAALLQAQEAKAGTRNVGHKPPYSKSCYHFASIGAYGLHAVFISDRPQFGCGSLAFVIAGRIRPFARGEQFAQGCSVRHSLLGAISRYMQQMFSSEIWRYSWNVSPRWRSHASERHLGAPEPLFPAV